MRRGQLSDYFEGIVVNRLSAVETTPALQWRQLTIREYAFRGLGSIGLEETISKTLSWLESDNKFSEIKGLV